MPPKKAKPEKKTLNFIMRVDEAFFRRLDDWRRKQQDLPSRAEAVRRLVMGTAKRNTR